MSHYVKSTVSIRSREALIAALGELGFSEIEVHAAPVSVRGYAGRTETAHVVLRGTGAYGGDVGFLETADGTWILTCDSAETYAGRRWSPEALARLTQLAGVHASLAEAARLGLVTERVDREDGAVDVYVYASEA